MLNEKTKTCAFCQTVIRLRGPVLEQQSCAGILAKAKAAVNVYDWKAVAEAIWTCKLRNIGVTSQDFADVCRALQRTIAMKVDSMAASCTVGNADQLKKELEECAAFFPPEGWAQWKTVADTLGASLQLQACKTLDGRAYIMEHRTGVAATSCGESLKQVRKATLAPDSVVGAQTSEDDQAKPPLKVWQHLQDMCGQRLKHFEDWLNSVVAGVSSVPALEWAAAPLSAENNTGFTAKSLQAYEQWLTEAKCFKASGLPTGSAASLAADLIAEGEKVKAALESIRGMELLPAPNLTLSANHASLMEVSRYLKVVQPMVHHRSCFQSGICNFLNLAHEHGLKLMTQVTNTIKAHSDDFTPVGGKQPRMPTPVDNSMYQLSAIYTCMLDFEDTEATEKFVAALSTWAGTELWEAIGIETVLNKFRDSTPEWWYTLPGWDSPAALSDIREHGWASQLLQDAAGHVQGAPALVRQSVAAVAVVKLWAENKHVQVWAHKTEFGPKILDAASK